MVVKIKIEKIKIKKVYEKRIVTVTLSQLARKAKIWYNKWQGKINENAEAKMRGIGTQVISASFQLMKSRTARTPVNVTRLVMVSGIIWA